MIIKTVVFSSALAACPVSPARPMVYALIAPVRQERPEQERPERTEPPHGEGSGESPLYGGMAAYGTATTNTTNVSLYSSGASGIQPYDSVAWLPNRLPLIVSAQDFHVVEPFVPPTPHKVTIQISPDTTKHLSNPSTIHIQRAVTRRRG